MATRRAELILVVKSIGRKALDRTKAALGGIGRAAKFAGVAIVGFIGVSLKAFRGQEKAVNSLNQSLVNQGIFTAQLSKKYQDLASGLQKVTTFGDEAIISAQAQLQAYLGQNEVTEDLLKSTLDFAAAMGVDLKTASDLVGKTIGSSTNALSRYGISLEAGLSPSEKLVAVQEELNKKFGGQAAAAAEGTGKLIQMKNAFGDVLEVIGERFAPIVSKVAVILTKLAEDFQKNEGALSKLVAGIKIAVQAAAILKFVFTQLGNFIGTTLAASFAFITDILAGDFKAAGEKIKLGFNQVKEDVTKTNLELVNDLKAIDDIFLKQKDATNLKEQDLVKKNEQKKAIIKQAAKIKEEQDNLKSDVKKQKQTNKALQLELEKAKSTDEQKIQLQIKTIDQQLANEKNLENQKTLLIQKGNLIREEIKLAQLEKEEEEQIAKEEKDLVNFQTETDMLLASEDQKNTIKLNAINKSCF